VEVNPSPVGRRVQNEQRSQGRDPELAGHNSRLVVIGEQELRAQENESAIASLSPLSRANMAGSLISTAVFTTIHSGSAEANSRTFLGADG
jgi:hypothetical protein